MTVYKGLEAIRNAEIGGVSVEDYLDISEEPTEYEKGVLDTLYNLARQILFLDRSHGGGVEEGLRESNNRYFKAVEELPWSDTYSDGYDLVMVEALLATMAAERPAYRR